MKKNISFFNIIYKIVTTITFFIAMVVISFLLVTLTSYSHVNEIINPDQSIEIINDEDIEEITIYSKNKDIYVYVAYKTRKNDVELLQYGYKYFYKYKRCIYLECDNYGDIKYITITEEGIGNIT